jgi:hypothetical protein
MPRDRILGLPRDTGGSVQVGSPEELAQVLAFEGTDLSSEMIDFQSALWRPVQDVRERVDIYRFLTSATEQVCSAGILPRPREELAPFGTRVEVMRTGGKPPPPNRYGTATVNGHSWISVFRTWHVHVAFDQPAGTYYGQPVKGTGTCMYDIHVIGGPERPFSSMTPTEIEELHEQRRKEFWRNIDPATGLTDPSLPRAATPESSSASRRSCSSSSSTAATPSFSAQIAFIVSTNGPDAGE